MNGYLSYFRGRVRCEIHSEVDQEAESGARPSETQYPSHRKIIAQKFRSAYFVHF